MGAVVYGSLIFVMERTGRMFWAIAQREKDIEKGREEGREQGREEGRDELLRDLLERNVDLPPEILRELEDLDRNHRQR